MRRKEEKIYIKDTLKVLTQLFYQMKILVRDRCNPLKGFNNSIKPVGIGGVANNPVGFWILRDGPADGPVVF